MIISTILPVLLCVAVLQILANPEIEEWTDLRITYSSNPVGFFNRMPRTSSEALADGWKTIDERAYCKNGGRYNGYRYIKGDEVGLALLYDINGIIAGVQMNLLKKEVLSSRRNPYKYDKVAMFQNDVIRGQEVFTLTAYFVEPATICRTGRTFHDLKRGTGTMLSFQNGPTPVDLIKAPLNRARAFQEGWSANNCMAGMGYHNFYKVEDFQASNCTEIRQSFLLFDKVGKLHGFGLASPGTTTSPRFEHPTTRIIEALIGIDSPPCIRQIVDAIGYTTMHVYFIDQPHLFHCWL